MELVDIAIIGTGPAGISAAITATVRNKSVLLFGSKNLSNKIARAHLIRNYPGLPEMTGNDFIEALKKHLEVMNIEINEGKVVAVYPMGDYFTVQCDGDMYNAKAVIIASGVMHKSFIKGEDELLGKGVSYCATCDAAFFKGKDIAVYGFCGKYDNEVRFLQETVNSVHYFLSKAETDLEPSENLEIIKDSPVEILGENKVTGLKTETQKYDVDGVFIFRNAVAPDKLISGIEMDEGHIKVDLQMQTNIPGCFACGDIAGKPYQYVKAAGQGNTAALSAVAYIDSKKQI